MATKAGEASVAEYGRLAREHGADAVKSLRFAIPESQTCRFDAVARLMQSVVPRGDKYSLLDVGCGLGDFVPYLMKRDRLPETYLGVDPTPEVIGNVPADHKAFGKFSVGTVFDVYPADRFDVVVGIGCFGEREPSWTPYEQLKWLKENFARMYLHCERAAIVTLHSRYKFSPRDCEFLVDPWTFAAWAHDELSERIVVDHQEMPHEIILAAYKGPSKWKKAYDEAKGPSVSCRG